MPSKDRIVRVRGRQGDHAHLRNMRLVRLALVEQKLALRYAQWGKGVDA
jgi:hypothetical protein